MTVIARAIGAVVGTNNSPAPVSHAVATTTPEAPLMTPDAPNTRPLVPTPIAMQLRRPEDAGALRPINVSCSTSMPRFMGVGDSIAALLVDKHSVDGERSAENTPPAQGKSTQDGRLPSEVLGWIGAQPAGTFTGAHVILSTGATNTQRTDRPLTPAQQAAELRNVQLQIKALFAAGAASVTVLGVGNSITHAKDIDALLRATAQAAGASYTGPLEGTDHGRWHPKDPAATLRQAQNAYANAAC